MHQKMSKTKVTVINFLTDALPQVIILFVGFFKIKIFINFLGEQELGLYQLYGQIIAYLVLIEGGVGSALLFRLYKPISEEDKNRISAILSAASILFKMIGIIIILAGIIISFKINFFVNDNTLDFSYMQFTFILYLISQSIYYFTIPYRTMFEADQKRYIPNLIFQIITILKSIIEIVIVSNGLGLIQILISLIICSCVANLGIIISFKKEYKELNLKNKEKDFTLLKDVKELFINTLGNLLSNNIDILIISKFIGLKYVVIYSTYNYFVEAIKQFVDKITGATLSSVGILINESKEKAKMVFYEFNELTQYLAGVVCIPLFLVINQFIKIWYNGKIEQSLILSILFSIILFFQIVRIPLKVFTLSSGQFKEIKKYVILEIIINVGLSVLLVKLFNIVGVLIATVISILLAEFTTKPIIILKRVFNENIYLYYLKIIGNTLFTLILGIIFYIIIPKDYSNIFYCIGFGLISAVINLLILSIYYKVTKQFSFIRRFKEVKIKK